MAGCVQLLLISSRCAVRVGVCQPARQVSYPTAGSRPTPSPHPGPAPCGRSFKRAVEGRVRLPDREVPPQQVPAANAGGDTHRRARQQVSPRGAVCGIICSAFTLHHHVRPCTVPWSHTCQGAWAAAQSGRGSVRCSSLHELVNDGQSSGCHRLPHVLPLTGPNMHSPRFCIPLYHPSPPNPCRWPAAPCPPQPTPSPAARPAPPPLHARAAHSAAASGVEARPAPTPPTRSRPPPPSPHQAASTRPRPRHQSSCSPQARSHRPPTGCSGSGSSSRWRQTPPGWGPTPASPAAVACRRPWICRARSRPGRGPRLSR